MTAKKPATTAKATARRTTKRAVSRVEELTASARDLAGQVQGAASGLVDRVPGALSMVESMPKSQRRRVASISVVAGAALWLLGAPRVLTLLAWIPALFVGGSQAAKGLGRR